MPVLEKLNTSFGGTYIGDILVGKLINGAIDLEQSLIDAVGLELPMSPLCRENCPGLCPDCGVALAVAEPGHSHEKIDPRGAGLADKLGQMGDQTTDNG